MNTTTKNVLNIKTVKQSKVNQSLWTKYLNYADSKSNEKMLWYFKVIIIITCVFMIPSTIVMGMISPYYTWFVALSILLFYANVIAHISEANSRLYVPLYHATIVLLTAIPVITYLFN